MKNTKDTGQIPFRVWIARYDHWQPCGHGDVPAEATALEPAEHGTMSRSEATAYVEAFNRTALEGGRRIWAIALPVVVRYEGDPEPGETIGTGVLGMQDAGVSA